MNLTRKVYTTQEEKNHDRWIGLIGWFVANGILWASADLIVSLLNRFFSEYLAFSFLSVFQLLVNIGALIFFAFTRRYIAFGALIAFGLGILITLCNALYVAVTCSSGLPLPTVQIPSSGLQSPPTFGSRIAYDDVGIYVIRPDGMQQTRLTNKGGSLDWSPDGKRIAFVRSGDIYVMNADGTFVTRLAQGASPSWSPDGSRIAFTRDLGNWNIVALYVMNADGTSQTRLADGCCPAWSPDGSRIAFTNRSGVSIMNSDGASQTRLADGCCSAWSPDGKQIAFEFRSEIYVINVDGTSQTRLANGSGGVWSPDGKQIIFYRFPALYVMSADGTSQRRLADGSNPASPDGNPAWSQDGKQIVYSSRNLIYVMNADGSDQRRIVNGSAPAWAPR